MQSVETHPWKPFVPEGMRVLMLGTFPPKAPRWSMPFYYPNFQNDMWRIWGWICYGDKEHFVIPGQRRFDEARIRAFCAERGIGLSDMGHIVRRLRDNASDKFLEIVEPLDLKGLLEHAPECTDIVVTGELASDTLCRVVGHDGKLQMGVPVEVEYTGRRLRLWRMPSSSRAYPRSIEWKAEYYKSVISD